jgi:hypothetical protein
MNMNMKGRHSSASIWALGALAVTLIAGTPAIAQSHGGGHGGGGGGHASVGGGGHASVGGARGGFAGGAHYAPRAGYAGAGRVYSAGGYRGASVGASYHGAVASGRAGYAGRSFYGAGFGRGGFGYSRAYWGGGYWHGGFWPRAYYGWGYPWFLGVLPGVYATYWWGGIPYYYANDVYYTWNSGYNGYVVTDPPPTSDAPASGDGSGDANYASAQPGAAPGPGPGPDAGNGGGSGSDVYIYPKNGQSDDQQATDRYECHRWAVAQSGFDPTAGSRATGSAPDYRRAMGACLEGRGYSAK